MEKSLFTPIVYVCMITVHINGMDLPIFLKNKTDQEKFFFNDEQIPRLVGRAVNLEKECAESDLVINTPKMVIGHCFKEVQEAPGQEQESLTTTYRLTLKKIKAYSGDKAIPEDNTAYEFELFNNIFGCDLYAKLFENGSFLNESHLQFQRSDSVEQCVVTKKILEKLRKNNQKQYTKKYTTSAIVITLQ